jgi:cation:H+ antiporter
MLDAILFLVGIGLLTWGAELLIRGAGAIAARFGVSPLVIGLTVVALGTSAPEVVTALMAAATNHGDMAIGNVIGSNIFNILVVLGGVVVIAPVTVQQRLVRIDVPLMIGLSLLVLVMALDGRLGFFDGAVLLIGFVAYSYLTIRSSRTEERAVVAEYAEAFGRAERRGALAADLARAASGMAALALGSYLAVDGAIALARLAGVSELVIGLTVVAASTSLPELATSIVAAFRKEHDIAVGNLVGSNIVNILLVLGTIGVAAPGGTPVAPAVLRFDLTVMIATALACLPIFATGYRIDRWEGFLMLAYYFAYLAFVLLNASGHDALPAFSAVMMGFVIPLTVVTLAVVAWRDWRTS